MIVGLMMGKANSEGFPGKNVFPVFGKPLMTYPLLAAKESKYVDDVYVTTDSEAIKKIAREHGAKIIDRPAELCTKTALGEDVYIHGYNWLKKHLNTEIEFLLLLMCNAATITTDLIDQGIEALRKDKTLDSAVSVSCYNMWSPLRARRIDNEGLLKPFVPFEAFGDPSKFNDNRDSQGDVWFADMGVSIVRPRCIENIKEGLLPQRWMGKRIYPLKQSGGFDVDYEGQLPALEQWLKKNQSKIYKG
jgi:GTP:adenosylcobinamide-phosphate guanylyltransferase